MRISDNKLLKELQEDFSSEFPFLKIEFYKNPHKPGKGSPDSERLDPKLHVGDVRNVHNKGYINLEGDLTILGLEKTFHNIFDLNVQVFRKSFGRWVQSWSSDEWTLKEQNLRGMLTNDELVII